MFDLAFSAARCKGILLCGPLDVGIHTLFKDLLDDLYVTLPCCQE